ncbi:MAG: hypothetical protein FJ026_15445 [Chloroflexi bacterium]|nr:hypothetical protein [Chloroflexota bacterium]
MSRRHPQSSLVLFLSVLAVLAGSSNFRTLGQSWGPLIAAPQSRGGAAQYGASTMFLPVVFSRAAFLVVPALTATHTPSATPPEAASDTSTPSPTATRSATISPTASATQAPSATASQTPTTTGTPTATPIATPTQSPIPTETMPAEARLRITCLAYWGPDEQVCIGNTGGRAQKMTGWKLQSVQGNQWFSFPQEFVLEPGATVRIHSGPNAPPSNLPTDLYWTGAYIWNNDGDEARLFDASGQEIDRCKYPS